MGQVTVSFLGVCTIFQNLPGQAPPGSQLPADLPANRVVLARSTMDFLKQHPLIDLHVGKLQLIAERITMYGPPLPPAAPPVANTYALDGVGLKILNPAQNQLEAIVSCLPSLQAFLPGAPLGPPAPYVFFPDAAHVQAWFDVPGGNMQGYLMKTNPPCPLVPSIAVLTMETVELAGAPNTVFLQYTPWYGTPPTLIALEGSNPQILVMNFAYGEAFVDDNEDFKINYTLAANFPTVPISIPTENQCTQPSPGWPYGVNGCGDAGPGCSTTNYP